MDKNIILAVVLSFVIIFGFGIVQNKLFPKTEVVETTEIIENAPIETNLDNQQSQPMVDPEENVFVDESSEIETAPLRTIYGETEIFELEFSTAGAVVTSIMLKEHMDGDNLVQMVNSGDTDRSAFEMYFGKDFSNPITTNFFFVEDNDPNIYKFYQDFVVLDSMGQPTEPFRIVKTYRFVPEEYMMELSISIENSENSYIPLNYNGFSYTLGYGPQIGPSFEKLDGRYAYRKLISFYDGDTTSYNGKTGNKTGSYSTNEFVGWSGIEGKYFGIAAITNSSRFEINWSNQSIQGMQTPAFLYLSRPTISSSNNNDVYHFYIGPKDKKILELYNNSVDNAFGLSEIHLEGLASSSSVLAFLEKILRALLNLLYGLIPNYGVAIILMTVIIKVLLFPITHKSYESTSKMQALQPKIKELQDKYKGDSQRLNQEMAKFYQKEGVNPMGGCLPMVLQMPILIAVYGMLNKYFDLRGAVFIPGWITDLSAPESVYTFGTPLPGFLSNFTNIRLLPIIYVLSQVFSMKFTQSTQPTSGQSGMQQKMMMYMMPIMFFFVLYNQASGLLLYWIVMNILTTAQQVTINKMKAKKETN